MGLSTYKKKKSLERYGSRRNGSDERSDVYRVGLPIQII